MALIIEDGSIVPNANSWVNTDDYAAYAAGLGYDVGTEAEQEIALRQAAIFIGSFEGRLKGALVERDQPLCFPREGLVLDGFAWADNEIPRQVKLCQMAVAIDSQVFGIDPYNPPLSDAAAPVRRVRIEGAVEREFAVKDVQKTSRYSSTLALLSGLLVNNGLYSVTLERA